MNLRERLRLVRPAGGGTAARSPLPEFRSGRDPGARGAGSEPAEAIEFGPGIETKTMGTVAGPVLYAERYYELGYEHGDLPLDGPLHVPEKGWERLLPFAEQPFPIEGALFLDLETTGLSRGAGTYAFLIGIGRFVEEGFRLRQFFLRDFSDELAVLEALRVEFADAEALVTFNGRSFDWPLLETRATMHRLRLPRLPHLDILHPARRLWRSVLGGCSLVELEAGVLRLHRKGDVPGHLIPGLYFQYLQTGDGSILADVINHNRLDILSMTALVGRVGRAVAAPMKDELHDEPLSGPELFALGRWLLPDPEGIACMEEALRRDLPAVARRECIRRLATEYKRVERFDDAVKLWQRLTVEDGLSPWAYVELAKHCEHRLRDFSAAREWTLRALELVRRRRALRSGAGLAEGHRLGGEAMGGAGRGASDVDDLLHRLRRIEGKLRGPRGRQKGPA